LVNLFESYDDARTYEHKKCNISLGKYDRELGNFTTKLIHTISTLAIFSKFAMSLSSFRANWNGTYYKNSSP